MTLRELIAKWRARQPTLTSYDDAGEENAKCANELEAWLKTQLERWREYSDEAMYTGDNWTADFWQRAVNELEGVAPHDTKP